MPLVIFSVAVCFVLYVLFGYPLLLAVLSRGGGCPVRKQRLRTTVSVLLPVRNGEQWIQRKLESILQLDYPRDLIEIIVVCDGCTDATAEITKSFAAHGVRLIEIQGGGKAVALTTALGYAHGDILFFTDVRQRLEPDSLGHLVDSFADANVGVVSGELIILEGETLEEANTGLYWKYEKWIRTRLSRIDSLYGVTGCIYAMRRELAVPIPAGVLLDDMYLPLAAFFRGYRVILDGAARAYDLPTPLHSEFSRKVRTLAGVYQILRYYPALLGPGNRMWLHFMSHKIGRLLLPWAMIAIHISSFWLPEYVWQTAVLLQLLFYALVLADPWIPEFSRIKRLSSPMRTFIVLMLAALYAPFALFAGPNKLWKHTQVRTARVDTA